MGINNTFSRHLLEERLPHDGASVHACAITITNDSASVHAGAA